MSDSKIHELPKPAPDVMRETLYAIFRHTMRGMVEVGWTDATGALKHAKQFDVGDLDDAAAFAARINATTNQNVYFSAGLRRTDIDRDHRAGDGDVISIAAVKIDCDLPGCLETTLSRCETMGIRPSLAHFSGQHPHARGALWWVLDEPEPDLQRVRAVEMAMARLFNSDPKVVNPSRVMRLPGSVAWPLKAGRIVEMTGALTQEQAPTRPAPYTIDEIESALRRAGDDLRPVDNANPAAQILDFASAARSLELDSLIIKAAEPNEWHEAALLAVAHMIGRGCPPDVAVDALANPLTQPGYSLVQTRQELRVMAASKRAIEWAERERLARQAKESAEPIKPPEGRDPFPLIANPDISSMGPPEWAIPEFLPRRGFGVLFGPSGTFKSFIAIDLALTLAYGLPWRGRETQQLPAAYIAGEGTHGVPGRIVAWREERKQDPAAPVFWLAPVAANFLDATLVKLIGDKLRAAGAKFIVVDTLARSFGGGNENEAQDMNKFVAACDYLREVCDAFVLAVHHTGKDSDRGARGSSVLRAAADVELSVSRGTNERAAIISVTKMKDAEDGARVGVRMVSVESVFPATGEVINTLVPVLDDENQRQKTVSRLGRNERSVMSALSSVYPLKFGQLKAMTGIENGTLGRAVRSLLEKNLVGQDGDSYFPVSGAEENQEDQ